MNTDVARHPQRKEIARNLLSRGLDPVDLVTEAARMTMVAAAPVVFPAGLAPESEPVKPAPTPSARLPRADVVVITRTVDELAGLARVLTPGVRPDHGTSTRASSRPTDPRSVRMLRQPLLPPRRGRARA